LAKRVAANNRDNWWNRRAANLAEARRRKARAAAGIPRERPVTHSKADQVADFGLAPATAPHVTLVPGDPLPIPLDLTDSEK